MHFFYTDFIAALQRPSVWIALTKRLLAASYQRTYLGSVWISLSLAITIVSLGFVYTFLFPVTLSEYMPFLALSYATWILISNIVLSGANVFLQHKDYILEETIPYTHYVITIIADKVVIYLNHLLVVGTVFLIFEIPLNWTMLFLIPAILIFIIAGVGLAFCMGVLAVFYRDTSQILSSIMQLLFFLTPILWKPDFFSGRALFIELNPFYHFLAIIRVPLLYGYIPWSSVAITMALSASVMLIGFLVVNNCKKKIAFWV